MIDEKKEKVDGVVFSMTGHFAHYGRNFHSIRGFSIDDNDAIINELYDVTHGQVIAKHTIILKDLRWQWFDESTNTIL